MAESNAKPTVTVTIPPYKFFVDKIAGDKVDVNVMVSNGNNPETYEPYAQQMMELSKSALYLKVGSIGFEQTWMKKLQDNAPDMKVIDTSVGIKPAKTPGGNIDPHVWMSCGNARIIASNIFKALCNLEPKNKAFFEKNYLSLLKIIDKRDSIIRKSFKDNPEMVRKFVIYHPILTYFARDYQLEQLAIEEEGREPSASQLKSLIQRARKENIKFCLIQAEFANRNTTTFINESQTKAMNINPLQGEWNWAMQEAAAAVQGKEIVVGK
ncbi:metal ABC transporter solute-binding protein, Zn/Mn family [Segatella copri]|uniref:Zinc ABC transporter substrate-binding protein n=1 Tax=Segatella copri TaxID=165179 RepID=A0AAW5I0N2_9BACT|nr:zinc ABC transporter substrate-binding protein [Segatella copri]MCF0066873.1 zinc ABC transporter substrate-binding protein [Segatella copri]MCP9457264.1 zinc ABC transporter substrate-binding protein [Segatella copri]MCP9501063.1 zinc ABC transporter substrate-binding protein [Segatella copri]MCP9503732.1 zinc ABC transporter substrate-binding protein [Segatella copri]MCP9506810.1 zinc ABC transporter substrate-binding protein [Segatella copri]